MTVITKKSPREKWNNVGKSISEPMILIPLFFGLGFLIWSLFTEETIQKSLLSFISAIGIGLGVNYFTFYYQEIKEEQVLKFKAEATVRQLNSCILSILKKDKMDKIDLIVIDNLVNQIDYWKDYYPEANTENLQHLLALRNKQEEEHDENAKTKIQQDISNLHQSLIMGPTASFVSLSGNSAYYQHVTGSKE